MAWTYILRCADGSYYVGSTTNLVVRLHEHQEGRGCSSQLADGRSSWCGHRSSRESRKPSPSRNKSRTGHERSARHLSRVGSLIYRRSLEDGLGGPRGSKGLDRLDQYGGSTPASGLDRLDHRGACEPQQRVSTARPPVSTGSTSGGRLDHRIPRSTTGWGQHSTRGEWHDERRVPAAVLPQPARAGRPRAAGQRRAGPAHRVRRDRARDAGPAGRGRGRGPRGGWRRAGRPRGPAAGPGGERRHGRVAGPARGGRLPAAAPLPHHHPREVRRRAHGARRRTAHRPGPGPGRPDPAPAGRCSCSR